MRLLTAQISAIGAVLLPLDTHKSFKQSSILLTANSTGNLTCRVDGVFSDVGANIPVKLSRSGTTVTVTFPTAQPHGIGSTVDWILISNSGVASLDGLYAISTVTNDTVLTYTSGTSATTAVNALASPLRSKGSGSVIGSSALTASSAVVPTVTAANPFYTLPYSALILQCLGYTAGTAYLSVRQTGTGR